MKLFVEPEEKAADALAQHVRGQGRAFSLFEAAKLVLAGADRHRVRIFCEPERVTGLFSVAADGALFETREEALRHLISDPAVLANFYSCEEVELEEPKGIFNSVGICGLSGTLLGPASHHSHLTALKRLHNERYSNMSFEDYRRRVRTENDPELVAKWKEQQRKGTKWIYLKGEGAAPAPAAVVAEAAPVETTPTEGVEPIEGAEVLENTEATETAPAALDTRLSFNSRAEMEAHFRRTHAEGAVTEVREVVISGALRREQLSPGLGRLVHRTVEDARKHLFELSQKMSQGLERRGLKLFKRRGGKMFVSRVKPKAIDSGVIFSARITAIVELVRKQPGILISKVAETLAPHPEEAVTEAIEPLPDASVAVEAPTVEVTAEAASEDATTEAATEAQPAAAPRNRPQGKGRPEKKEPAKPLTDDQVAIIRDLRWLADEGYVIEYGDGAVFIGVQNDAPREKPAKAEGKGKAEDVPQDTANDAEASADEGEHAEAEEAGESGEEEVAVEAADEGAAEHEPETAPQA